MNQSLHRFRVGRTVAAMEKVTDFARLTELVAARFDGLSPQLKSAARFLTARPDDVALLSMRELAQAAGLPPVTFVRLARALGLPDYSALRNLFQNRVRERQAPKRYSLKARDLQLRGDGGGAMQLLKDLFGAEIDNIELTYGKNHPDSLTRALKLVEGARRVFVLGQRSCYPAAYFFHYVYQLFRTNSVLPQNHGGTVADELRGIGRHDLLLAISIAPYTAEVVRAVQYAAGEGARILAITDDPFSPIARVADEALLVAAGTPSFFHSILSPLAILQALLAMLVARGGEEALAAVEISEKQLARFNAYWPEETSGRTPR
jgi:DNA-binding MurR/RpiR family transcriptional regulator